MSQADPFSKRLRECLGRETQTILTSHFAKNTNTYNHGDPAADVYLIETGQVKLLMLSPSGKECLLAIYAPGDVFGEACLSRAGASRLETATAMKDTTLKVIPSTTLLECLSRHSLLESFVQYLVLRLSHQQQVITSMVTIDSEQRLAETLLLLTRTLGKADPRSTRIEPRISHEELSQMVGTTRPRITTFTNKFRGLGLIDTSARQFLIVHEAKLAAHLSSLA